MKLVRSIVLAACALTLTLSAYATEKSITLTHDCILNGQKVAAGDYRVDYEINGSTADVKFVRGRKTVATATGEVVALDHVPADNGIVRTNNPDGSSSIVELQFEKTKSAIRFAQDPADKGN